VRYAPDHKGKTRARILAAAGRVFRRLGYHAAGVDRVMEEAGLTSGGFYAHFDSKEALLAEAIEHSGAQVAEQVESWARELTGPEWVEAFLKRYLSKKHCQQAEDGCPLAALVSEVSRADCAVKASFEVLVRELVNELAAHAAGPCGPDAEERAMAAVAVCVGGLGLARAVRDERFAEKLMTSCRKMAARLLCTGAEPLQEKRAR
jgi:TetR/AcrR family transcriptional repressor of nem operon